MRIHHTALYVNDLEAARLFFMTYLGAISNEGYHNPRTGFRSYFLTFDSGSQLEIMHRPDMDDLPKPRSRTGYAHVAFSLGSRAAVDDLTQRLRLDGYRVISGPRVTGDGYYESCVVAVNISASDKCFNVFERGRNLQINLKPFSSEIITLQ